MLAFVDSWRIGRVLMLGVVTASTAYGLGATAGRSAAGGLLGACLSFGGFLLDDYVDRRRDRVAGASRSPVAAGRLPPRGALALSALSILAAGALALFLEPAALAPMAGVVLLVALPSLGIIAGPIARALSLGALQALYALIGGLLARSGAPVLLLLSLFLFLAMTGGRVLGDVRDMPADEGSGVATIPIRYGVKAAGVFLLVSELLAYACGIVAWAFCGLGIGYLICMLAIAAAGSVINTVFLLHPTPHRADLANRLSLGLLGGLYTVGMLLARV